ncbi:MAG: hypothetical protein RMI56_00060 [Sulfolobales archaeon]|nr:hypothetical protein [Sulfolobales archaeon]MDW8082175.1 hypothetical protein [Sulfolobales archaeon]
MWVWSRATTSYPDASENLNASTIALGSRKNLYLSSDMFSPKTISSIKIFPLSVNPTASPASSFP